MSTAMAPGDQTKHQDHEKQPLLGPEPLNRSGGDSEISDVQRAIRQTLKSAAHLSNLLPTGTVLAFQVLSPIFTNQGRCGDTANVIMTACLLAGCALMCFLQCFTDSFKDGAGKVRYGIATFKGIWIIDGGGNIATVLPEIIAANYRVKFIDFMHAFMSVLVFAAVAMFDQNVVSCFYPAPSEGTKQVVKVLPIGIAVISGMFFVTFPTTRHGIGFPVSPEAEPVPDQAPALTLPLNCSDTILSSEPL